MIGSKLSRIRGLFAFATAVIAMVCVAGATVSSAQVALSGDIVVSRLVFTGGTPVTVGQVLPPGCTGTKVGCVKGSGAVAASSFPTIFNNARYDPSFGVTGAVYLDELSFSGQLLESIEVPNNADPLGLFFDPDVLVGSFNTPGDLSLHLSLDSQWLTFMGYIAPVSTLDVATSNTSGVVDPSNPVGENYFRAAIAVNTTGTYVVTETNVYSGGNARAAILNNLNTSKEFFYTAGSAGNGSSPQPNGVILGAGAQIIPEATTSESKQNPGTTPTPLGSFSITKLGKTADEIGKDDDFSGMTVFQNVIYYTKGSGTAGVNTVYFLDTTGTACPTGIGLPSASVALPTVGLTVNTGTLQTAGLPSNLCILKGFPSTPNATAATIAHPYGIWFANATTIYVGDAGDGYVANSSLYTHAAAQTTAGIQKWTYNATTKQWNLAYTLQDGLQLGVQQTVSSYPTGNNAQTGLPWAPAADGIRDITGIVGNGSLSAVPTGTVAILGVTSSISGSGDPGADPNRLMYVVDSLANTSLTVAAKEPFYTIEYVPAGQVLRGVSLTPGTKGITSF